MCNKIHFQNAISAIQWNVIYAPPGQFRVKYCCNSINWAHSDGKKNKADAAVVAVLFCSGHYLGEWEVIIASNCGGNDFTVGAPVIWFSATHPSPHTNKTTESHSESITIKPRIKIDGNKIIILIWDERRGLSLRRVQINLSSYVY